MGVKKITELEELTSIADDDVLLVVDISGTPTTKKITKANKTVFISFFINLIIFSSYIYILIIGICI